MLLAAWHMMLAAPYCPFPCVLAHSAPLHGSKVHGVVQGAGGKETVISETPCTGWRGGGSFGTPGAGEEGSSLSSPHSHDTCPPRFSTSTHHVSLRLETSTSVSLIRFPATILCCFISLYETLILWGILLVPCASVGVKY